MSAQGGGEGEGEWYKEVCVGGGGVGVHLLQPLSACCCCCWT